MEKTQLQPAPHTCKQGCERDSLKDRIAELEAQLAAPASTDTRDAFEAQFALTSRQAWQHKDGTYMNTDIQRIWYGWQAGEKWRRNCPL